MPDNLLNYSDRGVRVGSCCPVTTMSDPVAPVVVLLESRPKRFLGDRVVCKGFVHFTYLVVGQVAVWKEAADRLG
jgi:hypothetical protein